MAEPAFGPRLLIRQLHQTMAGSGKPQARLDRVVRIIAANMVADVCSVYVARQGKVLELFATEGLKQEAVHKTKLDFGEGLVGQVAASGAPLNLSEAREHPKFVYVPETGEEAFHSLLGVPVLHGGRVVGVLVVQNITQRHYDDEEVEALQTVAMVLAEIVTSGELIDPHEFIGDLDSFSQPVTLSGQALAEGIAVGYAVFHEPRVEITEWVADDPDHEVNRLLDAFTTMRSQLDELVNTADIGDGGEHREIMETYKLFAYDRGWQRRIRDAVATGLTAEAAVERVQQDMRSRMGQTSDPYLRERVLDLEDLSNRLIRIIMGKSMHAASGDIPDDAIVIARSMGPAELLEYEPGKLKGIVLEEGSPTTHVTIIARAMGVAMIGRVKDALVLADEGDRVILDTEEQHVVLRPGDDLIESYAESVAVRAARTAEYFAAKDLPSVSKDGHQVTLLMNAGLLVDLPHMDEDGAAGIGLFRTEFQFLIANALPSLAVQEEIYTRVLSAAGDRPVVFRTLDLGGDKSVPFLPRVREENPALGWRAIRVAVDRPALLRYQVRALVRSAVGKQLNIMFPLVADVSEFITAREIAEREIDRARKLGKDMPSDIRIGTMLEVPSLAFQLDSLLPVADFVSIGTNDLLQFFFASDRTNPKLADRYDLLSPAVLTFIRSVVTACDAADVPVTLCGEMGGKTLEAMALLGIGLRRLSISPVGIGPVRAMVRSMNVAELEEFILPLLASPEHTLRRVLIDFASEKGIEI